MDMALAVPAARFNNLKITFGNVLWHPFLCALTTASTNNPMKTRSKQGLGARTDIYNAVESLTQLPSHLSSSIGRYKAIPSSNAGPTVISLAPSARQFKRLASAGFERHRWFGVWSARGEARWLFPIPLSTATVESFKLYTPFRWRARVYKTLLLTLVKAHCDHWARPKVLISSKGPLPLETLVFEVTGERRPLFAISLGTGDNFRKLTLQVMCPGGEILGYIKFPLTAAAGARIKHEAAILERLASMPAVRSLVPRVLWAGDWGKSQILFQSAVPFAVSPPEYGPAHESFLQKLWSHGFSIQPAKIILEQVRSHWRKIEVKLSHELRALGQAAFWQACSDLNNASIRCGLIHGDFAPWNCRLANGQLFVFDWESAASNAPLLWDVFHFRVRVDGLLHRGMRPVLSMRSPERSSFLLFLLNSVCRTIEEEDPNSQTFLDYQCGLLKNELSIGK
jgi:hypothetical protein